MKITLDNERLSSLLKDRKNRIMKFPKRCSGLLSFSIPLLLSLLCVEFKDVGFIPAYMARAIYISVAVLASLLAVFFYIYNLLPKNKYNYKSLYDEIISLSQKHNFSIIAIKDGQNRFLLSKNKRWKNCKLFISNKLPDKVEIDKCTVNIAKVLADIFDIPESTIHITSKQNFDSKKYSESDKTTKYYSFYIFIVQIDNLPDQFRKSSFKHKNKKYYWMTFDEMLSNRKIKKMNLDVVDQVRTLNNTLLKD